MNEKKEDRRKKTIDWLVKIILVIIIILLLIHNCELVKKQNNDKVPTGNIDIIDIKCNDNKCEVPKEIESLSFAQGKVYVKKGEKLELIITVTPSELSSSKLTWKSGDSSIVTVDSNGVIKGVKAGITTITVTSSNGKSATCEVEVVNDSVSVKKIRLTRSKATINPGSSTQIIATIEPENATNRDLVWTSSDTSIATVNSKGVVKGLKSGTVTITAKTKDGKVVASTTITVSTPSIIEKLEFSQKNVSVKKGDTQQLIVIVTPSELSGSKLTWKSSDTSIVTVDSNGVIKGVKPGTATITVTSSNGKKTTCNVTVVSDDVNVEKITLSPVDNTISSGSTTQIIATIEPENATNRDLVWTSSDSKIATVDSKGVVKGLKNGTVTITAKTKDGKVVASTTITVNNTPAEIEKIEFTEDNISVKKGATQQLIVIVTPSELSGSKLTWKSSDSSIVTVDSNGVIKGVKIGTATITVTSENGKSATCKVEVVSDEVLVENIILTPNDETISPGSTTQIIATIEPENATNRDLVWTSSDTSIATVDNKGVVTGIKNGTVTITAKTKDGKVVASTTIKVATSDDLEIYDNDHTPLTWNGASDLQIFSKTAYTMDGKIAPESSNTYQFVIKNSTASNLKYSISFIETNEYNINMQYKLKKNDTYVIDHYVKASELIVNDVLLNTNENDTYYLEWKWISSSNDTSIGQTPEAKYGLKIKIDAEGTNE